MKQSPFLLTDKTLNQLTFIAGNEPTVVDLVQCYRDAKSHLKEVEAMLNEELNFYFAPAGASL